MRLPLPEFASFRLTSTAVHVRRAWAAMAAVVVSAVVVAGPPGGNGGSVAAAAGLRQLTVHVVATYPHDSTAFTEGLEVHNGRLFESVGLKRRSDVREVELATGKILRRVKLPKDVFGEGLAVVADGSLIQLSWTSGRAFRWTPTLTKTGEFRYKGEGWGLCYSTPDRQLIQSDGSDTLIFRDPSTFAVVRQLKVTRSGKAIGNLNELACDGTSVLANEWLTGNIVRIDLATGVVSEQIEASMLGPAKRDANDVLNGIARLANGHWLIAGKRWPQIYEVTFADK